MWNLIIDQFIIEEFEKFRKSNFMEFYTNSEISYVPKTHVHNLNIAEGFPIQTYSE